MKRGILLIAMFLPVIIFCQEDTKGEFVATTNAKKSLMYAQKFINESNYPKALKQLQHTVKIKDDFAIAYREMGKIYMELEKFQEAKDAYETSFDLDPRLSRASYFECGECAFQLGDLSLANFYYDKYIEMKGSSYANADKESGMEITYDFRLNERKINMEYLAKLDVTTYANLNIENLGIKINTPTDEYLPTITSDGLQLVFTRTNEAEDQNLMIVEKLREEWQDARPFSDKINTKNNEGMARFAPHGKSFYFAGCMREDTEGGCDLYEAKLNKGYIGAINRIDGQLNSRAWDSQPSITCDGNVLFFSSTRPGGQGGADIWKSTLMKNGEWSAAESLGNAINTPGDEEAPFISSDGKTLYFTSNGHQGQGEGDLFISRQVGGKWSAPINMGFPINSTAKELGIYVQGDGITAYFSSARAGGSGGMDIYKIELPQEFRPDPIVHLEGMVVDKASGEPIATAVKIGRGPNKFMVKSDETGWFFLCVPGNQAYSFTVREPGYEEYISAVYLEAQDNAVPIKVEVTLLPKTIAPKPELVSRGPQLKEKRVQFFFGFDSYQLNNDSRTDLDQLATFLKTDKNWEVEVVGYADAVGNEDYNKQLSEKRAKTIVNYLNSSGLELNQVVRKEGLGSIKMINDSQGDQSRRVDVVLRRK